VQLANEGSAPHTFTSDEPAVDEELQPGTNRAVELTLPAGGVVVFRCRFHVNQGMQGAIYFAEGDAAPTQTGTSTGTGGY
jgi:plastocyanin